MPLTYDSLGTVALSSNATNITFSSIPTTFTDLRLVIYASSAGSNNSYGLRFNGDTSSSYCITRQNASNAWNASRDQSNTFFQFASADSTNASPLFITVDIMRYRTTNRKTILAHTNSNQNSTSVGQVSLGAGAYIGSSPIDSVTFLFSVNDIQAGSYAALYGIQVA